MRNVQRPEQEYEKQKLFRFIKKNVLKENEMVRKILIALRCRHRYFALRKQIK